jgi:hypothetical protein
MRLVRPRDRADGVLLRDVPPLRRVMPYLMRTRTESLVYFEQSIDVEGLLAWLDETNAGRPAHERITLFHVVLTAIARAFRLRPELNRFVAGRRTYQRREIALSFIVKAAMRDEAPEYEAFLRFTGRESVDDVRRMVATAVDHARVDEDPRLPEGKQTRDGADRLVEVFASWPRPVLNVVARAVAVLDYHGRLPSSFRDVVPLFTSAYVVNTGSIGVDAPFHHLYEVGTASVFVSIGRAAKRPVVDDDGAVVGWTCLALVYTLDERASDGFYFARTAEVFRRLVSEPDLLARVDVTVDEVVPVWPPRG